MDIKKRLQDNNKRITKERIEIFSFLKTKHFFTYSDINEKFENISRSSIFRNLNLFTEIWIIRKIDIWSNTNTYEINDEDHHHEHMNCQKCETIINFDSEDICNQVYEKAKSLWFEIKSHSLWINGICKDCSD